LIARSFVLAGRELAPRCAASAADIGGTPFVTDGDWAEVEEILTG
jgi:hypothetical protein